MLRRACHDQAASAFLASCRSGYRVFSSLHRAWEIYYYEERYSLCLAIATKLTKMNDASPRAHIAYAASACALGKIAESIEHAKRAIDLDPENRVAHIELGNAYRISHHYRDAIREFDHALCLNSDDPHALAGKAILFASCRDKKLRDPTQAINLACRCCDLTKKQDPYCLIAYAISVAASNNFAKASKIIKEAMALLPSDDHYKGRSYRALLELFNDGAQFPGVFVR